MEKVIETSMTVHAKNAADERCAMHDDGRTSISRRLLLMNV